MERPSKSNDQLMTLWGIQESLLQSYRSLFISAQSIVVGFAAAITPTHSPVISIALISLGLYILHLWLSVCRSRSHCVSFVQWLIQQSENGEQMESPLCSFKEFQRSGMYKGAHVKSAPLFLEDANSVTRRRMDHHLPWVFLMLWLFLALYLLVDQYR